MKKSEQYLLEKRLQSGSAYDIKRYINSMMIYHSMWIHTRHSIALKKAATQEDIDWAEKRKKQAMAALRNRKNELEKYL